jgi:hypothetical protein
MRCPKCGFEQADASVECARCGVVFAKVAEAEAFPHFHRRPEPPMPADVAEDVFEEGEVVRDGKVGAQELKILGIGLVTAIVVYAFPLTRFLMSALVTLFHELGHAVVAWCLGIPAIPAFDFVYGGGITHYNNFQPMLALLIAGVFGWLGYRFRRNWRTLVVLGVLFAVWLFFVSANWRRELACSAAGHIFEFVLSAVFFYMALAGVGFRIPEIERPLGAFIAFFVQIHSVAFALRLRSDADFLSWYREGKGGMLMNDLESVALDLRIHFGTQSTIESVAGVLLLLPVVLFALVLLWYFYRARCHRFVRSLLVAEA